MSQDEPNAAFDEEEKTLRKLLTSLDVKKKNMECETDAIFLELTSPPSEGVEPIGLDKPLVDADGYPRGDIDVYRARSIRNRFRILQTDQKEIGQKIEGLLIELAKKKDTSKEKAETEENTLRSAPKPKPKFDAVTGKWVVKNWDGSVAGVKGGDQISFNDLSNNRDISDIPDTSVFTSSTRTSNNETTPVVVEESTPDPSTRPFGKVDGVGNPSPAADAGMKVGDLITRFGPIHVNNHDRLRAVATLVPEVAGENGSIRIAVLRRRQHGESSNRNDGSPHIAPQNNYEDENQWVKVSLTLHPRPFSGRGLLGCHIVPFDS